MDRFVNRIRDTLAPSPVASIAGDRSPSRRSLRAEAALCEADEYESDGRDDQPLTDLGA
jgi:hypothetical protein